MGKLLLVDQAESHKQQIDLPLFYMNDFSLLGLVVNMHQKAVQVLQDQGFTIKSTDMGTIVSFWEPEDLRTITQILITNNIETEMTDLMDGVYQG